MGNPFKTLTNPAPKPSLSEVVDHNARVLMSLVGAVRFLRRVVFYLLVWVLLATMLALFNSPLAQYVALIRGVA